MHEPAGPVLIGTAELADRLGAPGLVVLDCRFDLADPAAGARRYRDAHIPGARYAHLDHDLSAPATPALGRHPLPGAEALARTCARLGIGGDSEVVVYDDIGGGMAGRAWWLLRHGRIGRPRLLDGGWQAWLDAGGPQQAGAPAPADTIEAPVVAGGGCPVATIDEAAVAPVLIDARAPERYRGAHEPVDPRAGHIPGAVNRHWRDNLDASGRFLPAARLADAFSRLLAGTEPGDAVVYCGSGVTACHHVVAMAHAGLALPRLFPGSWSQWSADPRRPLATDGLEAAS